MEKQENYEGIARSVKAGEIIRKTVTYILLALWGVVVLFPFYWMVLTSLKSYGAYNSE